MSAQARLAAGRAAALAVVAGAAAACLPAPATSEARQVADLYLVFVAVATGVAVVVVGLTLFALVRYRARPGDDRRPVQVHGNARYEAIWTGIPAAIVVGLLALTMLVLGSTDRGSAPAAEGSVGISVTAFRWGWRFEYPADGIRVEGVGAPGPELTVPAGRPVVVTLTGEDVIHAFFVPQFLTKRDAIPGQRNVLTFTVDAPGRYNGECAEFCGIYHSRMPFTVVALAPAAFEAWRAEAKGRSPILVTPAPGAGQLNPASTIASDPSAPAPASPEGSAP